MHETRALSLLAALCDDIEHDIVLRKNIASCRHADELLARLAALKDLLVPGIEGYSALGNTDYTRACSEMCESISTVRDASGNNDIEADLKEVIQCCSRVWNIVLLAKAHTHLPDWLSNDTKSTIPSSSEWDDERLYGRKRRRGRNVEDGWWPEEGVTPKDKHSKSVSIDLSEPPMPASAPLGLRKGGNCNKRREAYKHLSVRVSSQPNSAVVGAFDRHALQHADIDELHAALLQERQHLVPPTTPELMSPSKKDKLWHQSISRAKKWRKRLNLKLTTGAEEDTSRPASCAGNTDGNDDSHGASAEASSSSASAAEAEARPSTAHGVEATPSRLLTPLANLIVSEREAKAKYDVAAPHPRPLGSACLPVAEQDSASSSSSADGNDGNCRRLRRALADPATDAPVSAPARAAPSAAFQAPPSTAPGKPTTAAAGWLPPAPLSDASDDAMSVEGESDELWPYGETPAAEGDTKEAAESAFRQGEAFFYGGDGVDKNYETAIHWYYTAAGLGHPGACNRVGMCCQYGLGTEIDYASCVAWYKEALTAGVMDAANNLGCFHSEVSKDLAQAAEFFYIAAKKGLSDAQTNLGHLYENGLGLEVNERQAARWYTKSAAQGNAKALNNLGLLHYRRHNYERAASCFASSAQRGYATAMNNLAICYEEGQGVARDLNSAKVMYREAAVRGNASAKNNFAAIVLQERCEGEYEEALTLSYEAAREGVTDAWVNIGAVHEHGLGRDKDMDEAVACYLRAADSGSVAAALNVGRLLRDGSCSRGVDLTAAAFYFNLGVEEGDAECMLELGKLFEKGEGLPRDEAAAKDLYKRAAQQMHDGEALFLLAHMYAEGRGGRKDDTVAGKLVEEAAFAGYQPALAQLSAA